MLSPSAESVEEEVNLRQGDGLKEPYRLPRDNIFPENGSGTVGTGLS